MQKAQILSLVDKIDKAMSKKWKFAKIGALDTPAIEGMIKAYHDANQVVVQQYPLVPEDQLEGE